MQHLNNIEEQKALVKEQSEKIIKRLRELQNSLQPKVEEPTTEGSPQNVEPSKNSPVP